MRSGEADKTPRHATDRALDIEVDFDEDGTKSLRTTRKIPAWFDRREAMRELVNIDPLLGTAALRSDAIGSPTRSLDARHNASNHFHLFLIDSHCDNSGPTKAEDSRHCRVTRSSVWTNARDTYDLELVTAIDIHPHRQFDSHGKPGTRTCISS